MRNNFIFIFFVIFQITVKAQSYSGYAPKHPDENVFYENFYENYVNNSKQKIKKIVFLEKNLTSNFSIDTLEIKNNNEKGEPIKVIDYKNNKPYQISNIEYENSIISKLQSTLLEINQTYTEQYQFTYNKNNLLETTNILSYRNIGQVPKSYSFLRKNIYDKDNKKIRTEFDGWSINYNYKNDLLENIQDIKFGKIAHTVNFQYNNQRKVIKILDSFGYEMNYDYDNYDNLIRYSYVNINNKDTNTEKKFNFDNKNSLKEVTYKKNSGIANISLEYGENNLLKKVIIKSKSNFIVIIPYNYLNNGKELLTFTREYYYDKNNSLCEIKHYLNQ